MIILEYIFYSIYRNISILNKWNPVSSATKAFISLLTLNIFTGFIRFKNYFDFNFNKTIYLMVTMPLIFLAIYHFNEKEIVDNIINKFNQTKTKKYFFFDLLVLMYSCMTIYSFGKALGVGNEYLIIPILGIVILSVYGFLHIIRFDK